MRGFLEALRNPAATSLDEVRPQTDGERSSNEGKC